VIISESVLKLMLDCCRDACCLINGGLTIKQTGQGRHLQCLSQNTDRA